MATWIVHQAELGGPSELRASFFPPFSEKDAKARWEGSFYSGTSNLVGRATHTHEPDKEHSWIMLAGGRAGSERLMEIWGRED